MPETLTAPTTETTTIKCKRCHKNYVYKRLTPKSVKVLCDECRTFNKKYRHIYNIKKEYHPCPICKKPLIKSNSVAHSGSCLSKFNQGRHQVDIEYHRDHVQVGDWETSDDWGG